MSAPSLARHRARLARVLAHIDAHLDGELSLAVLADVAACSPFHFHRLFAAGVGVTVHRYVQLARLERAAARLAFRPEARVTAVALAAGYDAPDAFARAFRARLGQRPAEFRRAPDWARWRAVLHPLAHARSQLVPPFAPTDVVVRDVPDVRVAVLTHRGDPALLGATIQRFIAWRRAAGLPPRTSATYNVFHDDPRTTPPDAYRLDLCAATDAPIAPNDAGVAAGVIPGGRCAVLRVVGGSHDLEAPATFLYRDWLPASGEAPRDFPLYCRRVSFFPDVPAHEAVTELYLPLR